MSKQESIIKFKGKMDGISFFEKEGKYVARKAKGPSREKILTHPNFARTRENMSEFTGLAPGLRIINAGVCPSEEFARQ